MYPEFEQWLSVRVSEAQAAVILDAFELLSELRDLRVWDTAVNVMSLSERLDTLTCLADLQSELRDYCIATALEYGITFNVELYSIEDQALVNKVLMTLMHVDKWEDTERILNVCRLEESSEEILAALCEEIAGADVETLLPLLQHVDPSRIDALITLYSETTQPVGVEDTQWHKAVYSVAKRFEHTSIANWLLNGGTLELGFGYYLNTFLPDFIKSRDPQEHAKYWILMGMASKVVETDLLYTQCVAYFDEVYNDLDVQAKVSRAIKAELANSME